jgi:GTP-binding protein
MSGKVRYIKSAVLPKDYPQHNFLEVVFVGRSNAGKSSLLNLFAQGKVAHVSQTPGKTRLINFFDFNKTYVLVDVPGYGFAKRERKETEQWQQMMEVYLSKRQCLGGLIIVMDIRRDWSQEEEDLRRFANHHSTPVVIAATKTDKISKNEIKKRILELTKQSQGLSVYPVSSQEKIGHKELEEFVFNEWIRQS